MQTTRTVLSLIILICFLGCKKEVITRLVEPAPFATAGTDQSNITDFQVKLNADSLKAGQSGRWAIVSGLVESKVFFADATKPDTKFNGMPGEVYELKWTVTGENPSESTVKITFNPLKAFIINESPGNKTKFFLSANKYDNGVWTIKGKYATLQSLQNGGVVIPDINSPGIKFQGYANTSYTLTWTTNYGSKSASATLNINTGNYTEQEALQDLQTDSASSRVGYQNGHIVSLDLSSEGITWLLTDTVTFPTMQALTYLKHLDLSGSAIFSFPAVIGDKYRQLEYLNLNFTTIPSMPDNIGNLTNLKQLYINFLNSGFGALPSSFGNLINLEHLELTVSGLTSIPESFGNLKKLTYFDGSNNIVQSLPNSVGNLSSLQRLWIYTLDNMPASISKLSKLRYFYFSTGAAEAQIPDDFGNLTSLDTLYFSGRVKQLPASFSNLNVRYINLSNTALTSLPDNFGNLHNLQDFTVYGALKTFPVSFGNLSKLQYLSAGSSIESLPDEFGKLNSLVYVDLSMCALKALPKTIGQLTNLATFRLYRNQIQTLPTGIFNLPQIKWLDISYNNITSISADIGKLSNTLTELDLYGDTFSQTDIDYIKQLLPHTTVYTN